MAKNMGGPSWVISTLEPQFLASPLVPTTGIHHIDVEKMHLYIYIYMYVYVRVYVYI